MFRRCLAQCPAEGSLRAKAPSESTGHHSIPFRNGPVLPLWPQDRPLLTRGLRVGYLKTLGGGRPGVSPEAPAPAPRARRAGDGGAGPRPQVPYLPHVGRQLAPGVVVPDVELHVYVHDAGSPGGRRRPGPQLERRLPPARPWPVRGARRRPHASHCGRPGLPHGLGSRQLGAARATGHGSTGDRGPDASAAPSFFLVSARRKRLRACVTSARRREAGGRSPGPAFLPAPCKLWGGAAR